MTRRSRLRTVLVGVGVTGAAVVAIALGGPSLASAADPDPSASASQGRTAPGGDRAAERAKHQDELATALATELGVDKDKVAAALAKIEAEREANRPAPPAGAKPDGDAASRLDAAVAAGTITQAEADAVKKAMDAGVLGGPHGGPRR